MAWTVHNQTSFKRKRKFCFKLLADRVFVNIIFQRTLNLKPKSNNNYSLSPNPLNVCHIFRKSSIINLKGLIILTTWVWLRLLILFCYCICYNCTVFNQLSPYLFPRLKISIERKIFNSDNPISFFQTHCITQYLNYKYVCIYLKGWVEEDASNGLSLVLVHISQLKVLKLTICRRNSKK